MDSLLHLYMTLQIQTNCLKTSKAQPWILWLLCSSNTDHQSTLLDKIHDKKLKKTKF